MAAERLVAFLYVCSVLVAAPLSLRMPDPDLYGSPLQWVTSVVVWGMVLVLFSWWRKLKRLSACIESKNSEYHMALDENGNLGERLGPILKEYEDTEDSLLAALLEKDTLVGRFDAVGGELDFLLWLRGSAESGVKDGEATSSQGGEDQSKMPGSMKTLNKSGQGFQSDADEEIDSVGREKNTWGRVWRSNQEEASAEQMSAGGCCV